jgi:branched-chain amino acid transport system substrate-binding protein
MIMAIGRIFICLVFAAFAGSAIASGFRIGVVAPQSGPYAILGQQIMTGARGAAKTKGDEIIAFDETCEEGSAPKLAEAMVAANIDAALGFLCAESLNGGLDTLKTADIPALSLSSRSSILMQDTQEKGWPLFSLAPRSTAEQEKLVDIIASEWADKPFALIEDGTAHSHELTQNIRNALEEKGLKPGLVDAIRPGQDQQVALVRRLKKAGITKVFISADRSDVAILARDVQKEQANLSILGGETMLAADSPVPLADGTQAVILSAPQPTEEAITATVTLADTGDGKARVVEGYMLPAYAAVTIAHDMLTQAAASGMSKTDVLLSTPFKTAMGSIRFKQSHERDDNPYALHIWQGGKFVPVPQSQEPVN